MTIHLSCSSEALPFPKTFSKNGSQEPKTTYHANNVLYKTNMLKTVEIVLIVYSISM